MEAIVSLKKNHEFRRLYQKGKSAVTPCFAVYCQKNRRKLSRLGITTGAKVGKAVERNRIRRRVRDIYRRARPRMIPGYDLVIVARTRAAQARYREMEQQLHGALRRLGLLECGGKQG